MTTTQPTMIPFTAAAYAELQAEQKRLSALRKEVLVRLQTAREMGDLSENGAYKYAKFELGSIGRQLSQVNYQLKNGKVVAPAQATGVVDFGSWVTVQNAKKTLRFMLVSEYESDPSAEKLSMQSPIGAAVLGKKVGETIQVELPAGMVEYEITKVE